MAKIKTQHSLVATVYDRKGRILAVGYNSYTKTHPQQAAHAADAGRPEAIYQHAEISALIKAVKRGSPDKIKIERYHKDGSPALAAPCEICQLAIKKAGLRFVEYTVGDDENN
mgnify:CR=1 FL=1